jgi:hypothetical protein
MQDANYISELPSVEDDFGKSSYWRRRAKNSRKISVRHLQNCSLQPNHSTTNQEHSPRSLAAFSDQGVYPPVAYWKTRSSSLPAPRELAHALTTPAFHLPSPLSKAGNVSNGNLPAAVLDDDHHPNVLYMSIETMPFTRTSHRVVRCSQPCLKDRSYTCSFG